MSTLHGVFGNLSYTKSSNDMFLYELYAPVAKISTGGIQTYESCREKRNVCGVERNGLDPKAIGQHINKFGISIKTLSAEPEQHTLIVNALSLRLKLKAAIGGGP